MIALTKLLARAGVVSVTPCFTCSQCFTPALLFTPLYSCFTLIYACTYSCFTLISIHMHMLYSCMLTPKCIYIYPYTLLVLYSCFTSRYMCNCFNPALLKYIYIYSCFTPTSRNVSWDAFLLQFSRRELFNNKDNDRTGCSSKWPFVHYFFTQFLSY
jgi:hypothetical protein